MTEVYDNVAFWSDRFREHTLFLYILLDPQRAPQLKQEAFNQHQQWNAFVNQLSPNNPQMTQLPQMLQNLLRLKNQIYQIASSESVRNPLMGYEHSQIINLLLTPQDFTTLVMHMIEELNGFIEMTAGRMTPQQEIQFWTHENAEHTMLAARLLPPSQLQTNGLIVSQRLDNTPPQQVLPLFRQSNEMALQLDQLIQSGQIQTIIDPRIALLLLEHEIKEAQRGELRIRQLQGF